MKPVQVTGLVVHMHLRSLQFSYNPTSSEFFWRVYSGTKEAREILALELGFKEERLIIDGTIRYELLQDKNYRTSWVVRVIWKGNES